MRMTQTERFGIDSTDKHQHAMDSDVILAYYREKALGEWIKKATDEEIMQYIITRNRMSLDRIEYNTSPKTQFKGGIVQNIVGNVITDGTIYLLSNLIKKKLL